MDRKEYFELEDEELDHVVGGVSVGDRVSVNTRMIRYCPNCARLATVFEGTVVRTAYSEELGLYFVDIKSDCCGHIERAVDALCTVL